MQAQSASASIKGTIVNQSNPHHTARSGEIDPMFMGLSLPATSTKRHQQTPRSHAGRESRIAGCIRAAVMVQSGVEASIPTASCSGRPLDRSRPTALET